jgi:hypothetical protein
MPLAKLPEHDLVALELAIATRIQQILLGVDGIGQVHLRPRYPQDDIEDLALSTVPDPVNGEDRPFTNVIELGIPSVGPIPYTDDDHIKIVFTYPITFALGVVDAWDDPDDTLAFKSSAAMFIGVYLRACAELAKNRTLGYLKVEHEHLQQVHAGDVPNDEGEAQWHNADWSLTVNCTSVIP